MMKRYIVAAAMMAALVGITVSCATKGTPPAAATPQLEKVDSSMLDSVGYDSDTQLLTVVFATTGETYVYQGVPEKTYKGLMRSKSKGQYFTRNIKNSYEFTKP